MTHGRIGEDRDLSPVPGYFVPAPVAQEFAKPVENLDLLGAMRRQWLWVLAAVVVTTTCAVGISLVLTPIYRAEVLLAPVPEENTASLSALTGQLSGLASIAGLGLPDGSRRKDHGLAILQSRSFTREFIEREGLVETLLGEASGGARRGEESDTAAMQDAIRRFDRDVRFVDEDKSTGLVRLMIQWKDPGTAAEWANRLVVRLNERMQSESVDEAARSIKYLEGELAKTASVEVRASIYRLIEGQMKLAMAANARPAYAFKVIDPATPPDRPVSPKALLLAVVAAVVGTAIGAIVALLRDRSYRKD